MSTSLPQNLNIQTVPTPKPYNYTYIHSMSYRVTAANYATNGPFLKIPVNWYGVCKFAILKGYSYYDETTTNGDDKGHIHIGQYQIFINGGSTNMPIASYKEINFYINYGNFDNGQMPFICTGVPDTDYILDLFIDFYY